MMVQMLGVGGKATPFWCINNGKCRVGVSLFIFSGW